MTGRARDALEILGIALGLSLSAACGWSSFTPVPVPELDGGRPFIRDAKDATELLRRNGEPRRRMRGIHGMGTADGEFWVYAARSMSPAGQVPPALLRIEFDPAGVVSDWYFLGPQSQQQLPVRETVAQARRTVGRPRWFCAASPVRVVDLEQGLQRHKTTKSEALALLRPPAFSGPPEQDLMAPVVIKGAAGELWEMAVDRPSGALIPATYLIFEVSREGRVLRMSFWALRGGCE